MRKVVEVTLLDKQTELQNALRAAEWLLSSNKAKHQSTVAALNTRIDSLEKRCQHMDILERQNVELCAQLRDLHTSKKPGVPPTEGNDGPESFQITHAEDITSPHPTQNKSGNKTVAAISFAALSVMALGLAARADTSRLS